MLSTALRSLALWTVTLHSTLAMADANPGACNQIDAAPQDCPVLFDAVVPEPSVLALAAIGAAVAIGVRILRRKK